MAQSPAHKFGQIIGDVVEAAVEPLLREFADRHDLYLDRKGPRPARTGRKVSWVDSCANTHDLDYVLEQGGSAEHIGTPVAFIETAWRRYTKHSRNKAQEIQGAILPLAEAHRSSAPFIGVILAGVFTDGALSQLRSLGFSVLYFPYQTVVEAFRTVDLDAHFTEDTADAEFARKVRRWERLPGKRRAEAAERLLQVNSGEVRRFILALQQSVTRKIELVRILPLHGAAIERTSVKEAISFVEKYREDRSGASKPLTRYEVEIRYRNGDRIQGQFADRQQTIAFLRGYLPPSLQPAPRSASSRGGIRRSDGGAR